MHQYYANEDGAECSYTISRRSLYSQRMQSQHQPSAYGSGLSVSPSTNPDKRHVISNSNSGMEPSSRTHHNINRESNMLNEESYCNETDPGSGVLDPIMALCWARNRLGCAYYAHEHRELYMAEDTEVSSPYDLLQTLIDQVMPKIIIFPEDNDDWTSFFMELHNSYGDLQLQELPFKDFAYDKGKSELLSWYAREQGSLGASWTQSKPSNLSDDESYENVYCEDPYDGGRRQAYLEITCLIDLESQNSVGCAGALFKYLLMVKEYATRSATDTDSDGDLYPFVLKMFSAAHHMHVSLDTQRALNIFEKEMHPNIHQKRGKESLSLYGVLNHASSNIGRHKLKSWLQRPLLDFDAIKYRQDSVAYFVEKSSNDENKELRNNLKYIANAARLVSRIREQHASPNDWLQLLQFSYYAIRIRDALAGVPLSELPVNYNIQSTINTSILKEFGTQINKIIDFEQSRLQNRVTVKDKFDKELDSLRLTYGQLDDFLLQVALEINVKLQPRYRPHCHVVYFPQLGYLITLPRVFDTEIDEATREHLGFTLQFKTADYLYYKDDKTRELDDGIGDIHEIIIDKEIEIIQCLSEELSVHFSDIVAIGDACAELDSILSLATAAQQYNYVKPNMTSDDCLIIRDGRHPMQELSVDVFIPNDIIMLNDEHLTVESKSQHEYMKWSKEPSDDIIRGSKSNKESLSTEEWDPATSKVKLLTGANFSGKSVYIRQIALIVYMAHTGSFVPASSATIGLTDAIFACIQTVDSVSKLQSAFAYDIQQMSQAVRYATGRSLVIVDEFGNGTDPTEGASLLCATLAYFLSKEQHCPKVLAITHFHELLAKNIISPRDHGISFLTMEILSRVISDGDITSDDGSRHQADLSQTRGEKGQGGNEVVFLYKVMPVGQISSSFGPWCASIAGIPAEIVRRAIELAENIGSGTIAAKTDQDDNDRYGELEEIARQFLQADLHSTQTSIQSHRNMIARIQSLMYPDEESDPVTST